MSTQYEPKAVLGYSFTHKSFIKMVKEKFPDLYKELNFEKYSSYYSMLTEDFVLSLSSNFYSLYVENSGEHIIGLELENHQDYSDFILSISEHSEHIKSTFKMETEPQVIFKVFKY
jgi:hypothetical protein